MKDITWGHQVYLYLSQLMRLWSYRRPAKAQASLRIRTTSPDLSLFAHKKSGSGRRARPNIRHLAPLDGCACAFEERVYEKYHNLMAWLKFYLFIFNKNRLSFWLKKVCTIKFGVKRPLFYIWIGLACLNDCQKCCRNEINIKQILSRQILSR